MGAVQVSDAAGASISDVPKKPLAEAVFFAVNEATVAVAV